MEDFWSKPAGITNDELDYWQYLGLRLAEQAGINQGVVVLDAGCGTGSSLFPAVKMVGKHGKAIGIDICPT